MEVRSESVEQTRVDKTKAPVQVMQPVHQRTRLQVWFIRVCSSILIWTCLVQLVAVGELWHPRLLTGLTSRFTGKSIMHVEDAVPSPQFLFPASEFLETWDFIFFRSCLVKHLQIWFLQ